MRFLKRLKLLAPVGLAVVALSLNPDTSSGQFPGGGDRGGRGGDRGGDRGSRGGFGGQTPGGFGGGQTPGAFGGGGFNASSMADGSFARLQASYGGTGDSLDYSKIPAQTREQTNAMAQRFGGEAMPASGSITKDQFREQFAKRMETMRAGGGRGGAPGATPTATVAFGAPGSTTPPGSGFPAPGYPAPGYPSASPGGFPGATPGNDPTQISDDQLRQYMSRYDEDRDGRISMQEAQKSDRLRDSFQMYDTNRDGFIDTTEYKVYIVARMSGGRDQNSMSQSWGQQQQGWGTPGWGGETRPQIPVEEPKPVVLRYGKLPKELPGWFTQLDTDQDGQVGMYEWRKDGRLSADFLPMDTNTDGYITAEEYLKFKNPNFTVASLSGKPGEVADRSREMGGRGGDPRSSPFGGGEATRGSERGGNPFNATRSENGPTKEEKKEEKKDERRERGRPGGGGPPSSGGGNPFKR